MNDDKKLLFTEATGEIRYNMTNDYMFRYILQTNEKVLRGLVSSLLHIKPEEIHTITIKNPINLAENVTSKEFIMDIDVMLNNNKLIGLEMQVVNEHNWVERSLSYLCRLYDNLYRGQEYEEALPVHHIGFLDFPLFPEPEWLEFFSTYMMLNVKNHHVYSDKFKLSVIDLSNIKLATEEDKANGIDYWASLFKAKTWEEIKMLAKNNEYLQEAADCLYVANAEELVRQQCRAREEAERHERTMKRDMNILREKLEKAQAENEERRVNEAKLKVENEERKANEAKLQAENEERKANEAKLQAENEERKENEAKLKAENEERKENEAKLKTKQAELELRMKQLEDLILQLQKK